MTSFLASLVVLLLCGAGALLLSANSRWATRLGAGGAVLGSCFGLVSAIQQLAGQRMADLRWPWHVPYGEFHIAIDPLSSVFLVAIFALSALAAVYGASYLLAGRDGKSLGPSWFFFNLLVASMALVVVARNGILFLVAWEVMAIASFFLVTFEHERSEVRAAGRTYLIAAHLGTAFLLAFFGILGREAGSLDFDQFQALTSLTPVLAGGLFALAVVGFGAKAGFVPFHVWLPEAHPAAPSHVSALMSGVMIKMGIYGILRALTFLGPPPAWWGVLLMTIGLTSGVLGVLFALAQHDLKRLLAYHSVENIGIIALGMGVGVWGMSQGLPGVATLGFAGALLHVVNHAAFKGLLFLGAGSVLHATGQRDMDRLGGLLKRMPVTGATFLVGAAAICGLPPLNGFLSEFLILLGSLNGIMSAKASAAAALSAVVVGLGLIGGLAVACFTKAFGVVFLGSARDEGVAHAHEGGAGLLAPLLALAAVCVFIGLAATVSVRLVLPATAQLVAVPLPVATAQIALFSGPLGKTMVMAVLVVGIAAALAFLRARLLSRREVRREVTWDCGYEHPTARMQYTSSSFAQPLIEVARAVLRPRERLEKVSGYFPKTSSFRSETPDLFTEQLYTPLLRGVEWLSYRARWLQQGRLHIYLLYIFITLVVLLVWRLGF